MSAPFEQKNGFDMHGITRLSDSSISFSRPKIKKAALATQLSDHAL
jgi:hypothetical protein